MPETIEDYYGRVEAAADDTGRLGMNAEIQAWEVFPFESDGLRLRPLGPLTAAEAPRNGEDPAQCHCSQPQSDDEWLVWTDDHWKLGLFEESGAPLILVLSPWAHHDFTTLPRDLAGEMGQIMVALGAAIEPCPASPASTSANGVTGERTPISSSMPGPPGCHSCAAP